MRRWLEKLISLWERYQHYIGIGGLVLGFSFDLYLAKRPDSVPDNILLLTYIFIAGAIIILLNFRGRSPRSAPEPEKDPAGAAEPLLLLLILQFCFGGLANNLLILYGKSGTVGGGILFVAILGALALSNEFLKSRYAQLQLNIAIYYFLVLTYCVISIPTFLLHTIGTKEFLISGGVSAVFIAVFLFLVYTTVLRGRGRQKQLRQVAGITLFIFVVFNGLYFLNIIPPVPLSLRAIGIYHSIVIDAAGHYIGTYEPSPWYIFWRDTSATYNMAPGQPAYCFSSVFAPTGLTTPVVHRWEYYDPSTNAWKTLGYIEFPITGGRAQGYFGYSKKGFLTSGQWRCDVETTQGQLIGRITFDVVESSTTKPVLSTATL